jgi:hypothetical protein
VTPSGCAIGVNTENPAQIEEIQDVMFVHSKLTPALISKKQMKK